MDYAIKEFIDRFVSKKRFLEIKPDNTIVFCGREIGMGRKTYEKLLKIDWNVVKEKSEKILKLRRERDGIVNYLLPEFQKIHDKIKHGTPIEGKCGVCPIKN